MTNEANTGSVVEHKNPWFQVLRDDQYYFVDEPRGHNAAAVLVQSVIAGPTNGQFLLVEQFRRAASASCLEIVRGYAEAGEDSAACAMREAYEETGYEVSRGSLRYLGAIRPNSAILTVNIALYYGQATRQIGTPDHEILRRVFLAESELRTSLTNGRILDSFTMAAYLLWSLREGQNK